jgi:uncharacterized protein (TIGR02266 family)
MSTSVRTQAERAKVDWAERRESTRVKYITQVHLGSDSNFYTGFSNNISEGGIFVATHLLRARGTVIDIEFSLPDGGPPIRVETEVRWICDAFASERPGMGLQFRALSPDERGRIEAFINQRETLFYED